MKKLLFGNITHIEEVHSIISKPPPWLVRFGTTVVLLTIGVFLFLLAKISYPEAIETSVTLTRISGSTSDSSSPGNRLQGVAVIGRVRIPIENRQKIKAGQQVILTFRAYPVKVFGFVTAIVRLAAGPSNGDLTDSTMDFTIELPKGLTTNLNKTLPYSSMMMTSGKIIVNKTSLLERMWNGLTKRED
jgi:hypothetical protein